MPDENTAGLRESSVLVEKRDDGHLWLVGRAWNLDVTVTKDRSDALTTVLFQQALQHPLPWRLDHDWTVEVLASDGYCIAKCQTDEEALRIIDVAAEAMSRVMVGRCGNCDSPTDRLPCPYCSPDGIAR